MSSFQQLVENSQVPSLLLFGPLALSFDQGALDRLCEVVSGNGEYSWILDTLASLPEQWESITASIPSLKQADPRLKKQLQDMRDTFQASKSWPDNGYPLPNTLLVPLAVAYQMTQYAAFINHTTGWTRLASADTETLGLCTGLLSAFAVSSAGGNKELFAKYGAVAMRLGLLVGMVVDEQDSLEPARSISVAWNSAEGGEEARRILALDEFQGTYISVYFDETRATVTSSPTKLRALQQRLRESSLISSELALVGPFHANRNLGCLDALVAFTDKHPEFHFADTRKLAFPTRSNRDGSILSQNILHHEALESILVHPPQWWKTFSAAKDARLRVDTGSSSSNNNNNYVVSFGPERCVPPSLMRPLRQHVVHLADHDRALFKALPRHIADSDIAVVGMACKVAGSDGLEEFWDLLCNGEPQHQELKDQRFSFQTPFRPADAKRKWFANLVDGADHFDHKFFKRSPRESATMDPQQRWMLQIAYQAVEQSGYFNAVSPERSVGCYIGLRGNDYYDNVACHPPNAFTATGNLQAFVAGKISHQFDWTGPAMTIDTACSSSLVAIHQACRAIIAGDCNAALAGGAHIMTSPLWFQNLAGASFLSTTGQCKPFDAAADGYCRGDGVGALFLKRHSQAIADGDQVLGVIPATAVQQNLNTTPIFVPNAPSLSDLFSSVTTRAAIAPSQISVVEAHGTGTAVGDPAEYNGIRKVLGGPGRDSPLVLGSVKSLVGHTECASGVVSAVKILLMLQKGMIPPQVNLKTINPALGASPRDNIRFATSLEPWNADFRAALINNYGASGSNASMIISQPTGKRALDSPATTGRYPFWLTGADDAALIRYAGALDTFLSRQDGQEHASLSNVSFNVARQSNRQLQRALLFTAKSVGDLRQKLTAFAARESSAVVPIDRPAPKPVVLCFGGQTSTFIGLDKDVYDRAAVLRKHLDEVDARAKSIGVESVFPAIFERTPITDTVVLHTTLFAFQYASAKAWIESGVNPVAVVGHSFGELTALCISGALPLDDTLKMIVARARLIRDSWGAEKGAMMAIEADLSEVEMLLHDSAQSSPAVTPATIACYNGPRSFTLAGSVAAIDAVADTISKRGSLAFRTKRLNVSNAYHCSLVDPLTDRLEENARDLNFREPVIPLESTSRLSTMTKTQSSYFSEHMRSPVFFHQAVERLHKQYPSSIFLEAGSNSTVTSMAGRALGNPTDCHFQGINITCCDDGWDKLTDATVNLWKAGLTANYWGHHAAHTSQHTPLLLPPYQFEKSSHWLELKSAAPAVEVVVRETAPEVAPKSLINFTGYQKDGDNKPLARFQINTALAEYEKTLSGHVIAQEAPICPATMQTGFVLNALSSLKPELSKLVPQTHGVKFLSPICRDPGRSLWIDAVETKAMTWEWSIYSTARNGNGQKTMHTSGQFEYSSVDNNSLLAEISRYERLFSYQRCVELLNSNSVDNVLEAQVIYMLFSNVVEYGEEFRGVKKLVGKNDQSAAHIVRLNTQNESWYDAHLADTFCQLGGIWANCMANDRLSGEVFIANGIEQWVRSPRVLKQPYPSAFHVYATNARTSDRATLTDVFIFDAADGCLVEAILGIGYSKCPKASLQKLLARLTAGESGDATPASVERCAPMPLPSTATEPPAQHQEAVSKQPKPIQVEKPKQAPKIDVMPRVKAILADLSGLEMEEIKDDSQLADLGIDSLVGMEMAHEIEAAYDITLPENELIDILDLPGLIACVQKALGGGSAAALGTPRSPADSTDDDWQDGGLSASDTDVSTPPSSPEIMEADVKRSGKQTMDYAKTSLLAVDKVMDAFSDTKNLTDGRIAEQGQTEYVEGALPRQTELTIALTLEAFESVSQSPLQKLRSGETLDFVPHKKEQRPLVRHLYRMLETETQTIVVNSNDTITRTAVPFPKIRSSEAVYQELMTRFPDQSTANKLTKYAGTHLAEVLSGKTDGVKLIFGSAEGRELVSGFYADWPLNQALYKLMDDFFNALIPRLNITPGSGPLKILEMGAGTGGTTKRLLPLLARLGVPIEYTFTDLAPSLVAAARKKWGKEYPFMKFRTHDIEKVPDDDLIGTQHIVLSSNAVHATHSLVVSTGNIRKMLRPDGLLLMLEMTRTPYWVDLVFGLFEGWWLFEDGRSHALTHEDRWRKDLQTAGYGHVDWTQGTTAESEIEKLVIALADPASVSGYENHARTSVSLPRESTPADCAARQAVVDRFVAELVEDFDAATRGDSASLGISAPPTPGTTVLITGATGSLGSHLVEVCALMPSVSRVVCLNRRSKEERDPANRQRQAMDEKGIPLSGQAAAKMVVLEADLSKPQLGLTETDYAQLVRSTTHIVHNAWPMCFKWPVKRFEPNMQGLLNLLILSHHAADHRRRRGNPAFQMTFQFISSIAVVGHYPYRTGKAAVPEERMCFSSVLPTGYGDAKYVCERVLDETLHRDSDRFHAMSVRLGQIAGSSKTGFWNMTEHVAFMLKSSQTLKALPDFGEKGVMSWTPVDVVAQTCADLLFQPSSGNAKREQSCHPIYHIDNPIRQSWSDAIRVLAKTITPGASLRVLPFKEWTRLVREYTPPASVGKEKPGPEMKNPAKLLIDFLEDDFERMSCGGVLLGTAHAREHSRTLAGFGAVSEEYLELVIGSWRQRGFLE
ncbi:Putative Acyl transferase domain superfamily, phosphopantetheine binding ACP domain, thiolase [Colletotrichum destructivum]|uniref:Acyl transferase domain superfamily, phosphopantetheine binding ACP domain, thiolase n=1 Tax=Colletotrichum destructivum TaxID=34406 RepID=A0AAX4IQP0_9PEZI|nr:Putative Acyl transferase domain superfamily, phosphopantetheine binding ACP domain, thiolase [Colletotrichum destructivum]